MEDPELRRLAKLHALSWFHGLAGLQQLGGLPLVKPTMEGLKRMLAKPKVRKEPVTADMLKATGLVMERYFHWEVRSYIPWYAVSGNTTDKGGRELVASATLG